MTLPICSRTCTSIGCMAWICLFSSSISDCMSRNSTLVEGLPFAKSVVRSERQWSRKNASHLLRQVGHAALRHDPRRAGAECLVRRDHVLFRPLAAGGLPQRGKHHRDGGAMAYFFSSFFVSSFFISFFSSLAASFFSSLAGSFFSSFFWSAFSSLVASFFSSFCPSFFSSLAASFLSSFFSSFFNKAVISQPVEISKLGRAALSFLAPSSVTLVCQT